MKDKKTMNTLDSTENTGINAADFLGSYLAKEDIREETLVTIIGVAAEEVPGENRKKLVVQFAEFEKRMIVNSTNNKRLSKVFGSTNTADWHGPVILYVDEHVEYAGKAVGGLRVKPAGRNGAEQSRREQTRGPSHTDEAESF